jgi:hypothetical protein
MLGISYKALLYKMRQFNLDSGRGARSAAAKEAAKAAAAAKEAAARPEDHKETKDHADDEAHVVPGGRVP